MSASICFVETLMYVYIKMCKIKMNKILFKPIGFRYSKQYRLVWALADRLYVDGHFYMIGHLILTSEMECKWR